MGHKYGAGSVYQRKRDGKWVGQWEAGHDERGRRLRPSVMADTEAGAWKAMAQARGSSSTKRRRASGESVEVFLNRWLREVVRVTRRERTLVGYRQIVDNHLVPAFGTVDVRILERREVQTYVNGLTDLSPLTVKHIIDCGKVAMSYAVRWGLRDTNPFTDLDMPRIVRRNVRALSPDDARKILAATADTDIGPLVSVALWTGLRQGELLGLRWEDVDLGSNTRVNRSADGAGHGGTGAGRAATEGGGAAGLALREGQAVPGREPGGDRPTGSAVAQAVDGALTVAHSLARLPGPGGTRYVLTEPKTDKSRRTVPLPAPALASLRAHRKATMTSPIPNPLGLVFWRERDGKAIPLDGTVLTRQFQEALTAAKLPSLRWHDLRHACASLLIGEGIPLAVVSSILGHSGIAITVDVYGHLTGDVKRDAMDRYAKRMEVTG